LILLAGDQQQVSARHPVRFRTPQRSSKVACAAGSVYRGPPGRKTLLRAAGATWLAGHTEAGSRLNRDAQIQTPIGGATMTITKILCGGALLALAAPAVLAQERTTISGTCAKPDVSQSVPAGDAAGHAFMIQQGKCVTKGQMGGSMSKSGAFAEHDDVTAHRVKGWGVYVETYDSGDQITYNYQLMMAMKDGALQSGKGTFQAIGGTGKMKGVKAMGSCSYKPGANEGTDYSCTGEFTLKGAGATAK
jgi:hypothetical protein